MTARVVQLALELADACGALQVRDLLREIHLEVGGYAFLSMDLFDADRVSPDNERLRDALVAACGEQVNAKILGNLLERYEGIPLDGLIIGRDTEKQRDGVAWTVSRLLDAKVATDAASPGKVLALPTATARTKRGKTSVAK